MEEDGTEIEDTDYLFCLPDNTALMLLHKGDRWSPYGLGDDVVDYCDQSSEGRVFELLLKIGTKKMPCFITTYQITTYQ